MSVLLNLFDLKDFDVVADIEVEVVVDIEVRVCVDIEVEVVKH